MKTLLRALVLSAIFLTVAAMMVPDQASGVVIPTLRMVITRPDGNQDPLYNVPLQVRIWRRGAPIGQVLTKQTDFDGTCVFATFGVRLEDGDIAKLLVDGPNGCVPFEVNFTASLAPNEGAWILYIGGGGGSPGPGGCGVEEVTIGGEDYWHACALYQDLGSD